MLFMAFAAKGKVWRSLPPEKVTALASRMRFCPKVLASG
jgi:hypothetical protein